MIKKTKYAWYLLLTTIFTSYLLIGIGFAMVDQGEWLDSFISALTFKEGLSINLIIAGILFYEAIGTMVIMMMVIISILRAKNTKSSEYWLLVIGLVPFLGPLFGFSMLIAEIPNDTATLAADNIMSEEELANHSKVAKEMLVKTQEISLIKDKLKISVEENKSIKINKAILMKQANKKKIYVTAHKTTDPKGKDIITWNVIDKSQKLTENYATKIDALLAAKKVQSPKKVLIQDEHGKFEYWLTYLDDDNTPIVKAGKKDLAEKETHEIMHIMKIKAPSENGKNIYAQSKKAEKEKTSLKIELKSEIAKVKLIKLTHDQLVRDASKNIIYVTVKKEAGKIMAWNIINKGKGTKEVYTTKKEALLAAKKIKSPKKVLIQGDNAQYEYWLTYLDESNKPLVKINKKTIVENQMGKDDTMKILEINNTEQTTPKNKK